MLCCILIFVHFVGSRDGIVVIALASQLPGPGSGHEWVKLVAGSLLTDARPPQKPFSSEWSFQSKYE